MLYNNGSFGFPILQERKVTRGFLNGPAFGRCKVMFFVKDLAFYGMGSVLSFREDSLKIGE